MSEFEFFAVLIIAIILSLLAIRITWKVSDFFISPGEYFFKSGYQIMLTKIGMCAGIGIITIVLTFKLKDAIIPTKPNSIISTNSKINSKIQSLENNSVQFNSNKSESNIQNFTEDKIEKNRLNTLKKDNEIDDIVTTNNTKGDEELQIAIEMLKEGKSVREIAESTSFSKKEVRKLKRELRKEE